MIFEKQPKHSNEGIQLKFCAFKLKAMDDLLHSVKNFLHCKHWSYYTTLELTQRFM